MRRDPNGYNKAEAKMLFGMSPEAAMDYLGGKSISQDWQSVYKDAHTKSFIIAGEVREAVLTDVLTELKYSMEHGGTVDDFKSAAMAKLERSGWLRGVVGYNDKGDAVYENTASTTYDRLDKIFRNNMFSAYSAGIYTAIMDSGIEFVEYIAIVDDRSRDEHKILNGKIFHKSDPFLIYFAPQNGYGCRCSLRGLTEQQVRRQGFDPDTIRVAAKSGNTKIVSEVDDKGNTINRAVFEMPDGKFFKADKGWDYNPALSFWEQRVVKANLEDGKNYREVVRNMQDGVVVLNSNRPLPVFDENRLIHNIKLDDEAVAGSFLTKFLSDAGADDKGVLTITDPLGKPVFMSQTTFTNSTNGKLKIHKGNRWQYLNYLPEVVRDADFVMEYQGGGAKSKRVYYYKAYSDGDRYQAFLVVVSGRNVGQSISAYNLMLPTQTPISYDIKRKIDELIMLIDRGSFSNKQAKFKQIFPEDIDLL